MEFLQKNFTGFCILILILLVFLVDSQRQAEVDELIRQTEISAGMRQELIKTRVNNAFRDRNCSKYLDAPFSSDSENFSIGDFCHENGCFCDTCCENGQQ
jgi:hypothetical protein